MVDTWDRQEAAEKCSSYNGGKEYTVRPFGLFWTCSPVNTGTDRSGKGGKSSSGSSSSSRSKGSRSSFTPPKPAGPPTGVTIQEFGIMVSAKLGLESGIQFQRRDAAGVGIQSVIDLGFLDAVDVWGDINGEYEVCFPQAGDVIFLDASTSPRTQEAIEHFTRDGYTCATHETAGMMVLVTAASSSTSEDSSQTTVATVDPGPINPLSSCEITTLYRLNLRNEPDGDTVYTIVPHQVELTATARTEHWFRVAYEQWEGWLAARYVSTYGSCRAGIIT